MTRLSPSALRRAVLNNAMASPMRPHWQLARSAQSYGWMLTPQERWFLDALLKLSALSERQQDRLNAIASKVERGRK
jgi:hypothetical protein